MPAPNKIYIQIDIESKDAEKAVDEVNKKIKEIGPNTEKSSEQASKGIKRVSTTIEQTAGSMDKLAEAIASLGILNLGRNLLAMGDDLNRVRLGMQNMEGGASSFILISDLAQKAGVDFRLLLKASQELANAGTAPALIASRLKILVDQAKFAGKGMEEVLHVAEKLRAVGAKQFLSGEDIGTFSQIGIRINEQLLKTLGVSRQKLMQEITKLRPQEFEAFAYKLMEAQSKGAAEALKKQLPSAAFEETKAKVVLLAGELETTLAPVLIRIIQLFGDLVDKIRDLIQEFNRLPKWFKDLAGGLALVAAGVWAVNKALALWSLLIPAGVGLIARLGPVLVTATEGIGAFVTGLGLFEAASIAVGVAMEALLPILAAVGAGFVAGSTVGGAINRWFPKKVDPEELKQQKEAIQSYDDMLAKAVKLESELTSKGIKLPEMTKLDVPKGEMTPTELYPRMTAGLTEYIGKMEEAKRKHDSLMEANEEEVKRAKEYGAKVLADAQRDQLKITQDTVAALAYTWKEHWKNTEKDAGATADALNALQIAMTTEALKQIEIVKTARIKANLEAATTGRDIAIARIEAIPDTGPAAQQQIARARFEAQTRQLRQQADENIRVNNETLRKQTEGARFTALEALKTPGVVKTPGEVINLFQSTAKTISLFQKAARDANQIEEEKIISQTEKARLDMVKTIAATDAQIEKEARDTITAYNIEGINAVRDYTIATTTAVEAYTKQQKLAQIDITLEANLTALKLVQKQQIENINATAAAYEQILQAAVDMKVISGEAKEERLRIYRETVTDPQIKAINQTANNQAQMQRIESWRTGNQVIIEEQKQVYETISGVMGELFDAFLDKNKSVWSAIGDVIKRTILGALKTIVTSRLAAAFTGMLGYGQVGIAQGPLGQQIPVFGGGAMPTFAAPTSPGAASSGISYAQRTLMDTVTSGIVREVQTAPRVTSSGGQGSADRMMDEADTPTDTSAAPTGVATGGGGFSAQAIAIRESFNIGKPVMVTRSGVTKMVPWTQATGRERLGSMLKSQGAATMAASIGLPMFLGSLQKKGVAAGITGIVGGGLAGYGLATMFGAYGPSGALAGIGLGLFAAGYKRRGVSGLAMTTLGGTLAGAGIGNMIMPGVGAVVGAAVGAAVGLGVGIVNLFRKSTEQQVRSQIQQTYGIDIRDNNILTQIAEIAKSRFGGDIRMAVHSTEVQEMIRIYSLMTGQNAALPREMYSATYAQSAAGGLQLQPVYSGGRLVSSPYSGTTTTQFQNALASQPPVFVQLNPQQASSMFSGQVVQVLGNNPGAVGAANTTAARSGSGRQAQSGALLEPSTVMA